MTILFYRSVGRLRHQRILRTLGLAALASILMAGLAALVADFMTPLVPDGKAGYALIVGVAGGVSFLFYVAALRLLARRRDCATDRRVREPARDRTAVKPRPAGVFLSREGVRLLPARVTASRVSGRGSEISADISKRSRYRCEKSWLRRLRKTSCPCFRSPSIGVCPDLYVTDPSGTRWRGGRYGTSGPAKRHAGTCPGSPSILAALLRRGPPSSRLSFWQSTPLLPASGCRFDARAAPGQ